MIALAFFRANWAPIAIIVGVVALLSGVYLKGHYDGTSEGRAAQMQATFDQLKQRSDTDAAVKNMSDADRCRAIGGELRDGKCV